MFSMSISYFSYSWKTSFLLKPKNVSFTLCLSFLGFIIEQRQVKANLVKIQAVVEWPAPVSRKHLRFLGFANFYCRFIRNFSKVAAPLTQLTSIKIPFVWTPDADAVFITLKQLFTSAPFSFTRIHLFSSWWRWMPRTLEWGQCFLNGPQRIINFIPVLFFLDALHLQRKIMTSATGSCCWWGWWLCLSLSGQIIKTWLIFTLQRGSILARWAMFLDRFDYNLTYRPGSRNAKPDALSRQSDRETFKDEPENILPSSCIVAAVSWRVEALVKQAPHTQPDPGNGPPNRLFVPDSARSQVLQWAHTSKITCYPGFQRTLEFLRRKFWWPTMAKDTRAYIAACSVCARNKSSHQ